MADGNFCDFQGPIDTSMMSSLPGFWERTAHESYGVGALECLAECAQLEKDVVAASNANNNQEFCRSSSKLIFRLIKQNGHNSDGIAAADSTVADVNKDYYNNCALNGSPDDSKELQMAGVSGGPMGLSALHQNMLAKPVPMKRLSEKCIVQARACLESSIGMDRNMCKPPSMMQTCADNTDSKP
ncbi:uncharacterized protein LOC121385168 [Gigantopelta aegis]|uniref:uncharacterized protein LOC121385168 n=1 Tax=Gigantopelta aegis TaxID=1735272 RepID=UPI001B88DFFC|nr:uncharacterized protein LOC121385168 [Gigantopelta aegis]